MRGLVWFREDIRTQDNTALFRAAEACEEGLIGIFILDTNLWKNHDTAACRVEFVLRGLQELKHDLNQLNIPLIISSVPNTQAIPKHLFELMEQHQVSALFFNKQYEINESRRDTAVTQFLNQKQLKTYSYDDQTIFPPGHIKTQQGKDYSIFTPYKRAWYQALAQQPLSLLPPLKKQTPITIIETSVPTALPEFHSSIDPTLWPAGQSAAQTRLNHFVENHAYRYDQERDFPAIDHTSKLSAYLATGMISARQCFMSALIANDNEIESGNTGICTWMNELIWREFYKHTLVSTPRVSMHLPYKLETQYIPWHYNESLLQAWQNGVTGYPIIDAAMRQLNTTGWMHNRLRMVVAMFLSKNLFLNWQLGERYFMLHLIDGDLAANNGGWQWSASTGTDAAPYFRIFNPIRQSLRFDPDGKFIKQYCPELSDFDKKSIHEPYAHQPGLAEKNHYPKPIIELNQNRSEVMAAFKNAKC